MSQSNNTPSDSLLIPATDPVATEGVFFTVAELRAAMSPVGYMTPADQINAAAAAAAQATANAAIPSSTLGQPLGPVQSDATNKIPLANLPAAVLGSSHYLGTWNASTNTPLIVSGTAPNVPSPVGGYYIVSVAGTPTIDGVSMWHAGDWIIWNGTSWSDLSGQVNPVSSVAGLQGAVSTAQLATALAGGSGLSSAGGLLNVVLGTTANAAAAGNDSRITGAAPTSGVYTYLADVTAIANYTGNSPALRTAGYNAPGDGGGAFYTQTNTGAPAISDGAGRSWYLQDIDSAEVNILQFGAVADGETDMQPAWAAADAFAAANKKAVFIPSPGAGTWVLKTPMVATAFLTRGEAANIGNGSGTAIHWAPVTPTELETALTSAPVSGSFRVSDLSIVGRDVVPAIANVVTSGWLPALASASCSFSGGVMTATGTTGAWAVGQTVSGPGMSNYCTITGFGTGTGGDGTYTLSSSQGISGSITVTATGYPNLSAFKSGTACFRAAAQGVYRNCYASGSKYGMVLDDPGGHVFSYNCTWTGFFGVYCRRNTGDFYFEGCFINGNWAGILGGTDIANTGNGGVNFRAVRCHMGFCPVGVEILNDGGTNFNAGYWEFYGSSFESFGEAVFRTLPGCFSLGVLLDMYPNGSFNSSYQFPASVIGNPAEYFFYLPGTIVLLKSLSSSSIRGTILSSGYPSGSIATAYIGTVGSTTTGDLDLDMLAGSVVFGSHSYTRLDIRNPDTSRDFLRRREQIIRSDLLDKGNLLLNPEIPASWAVVNSGSTVSVAPLSSLMGGALSGINIPQQVYRESNNPNVIVISNASETPFVQLGMSTSSWNTDRSLWLHGWAFSPTGSTVIRLSATNGGFFQSSPVGTNPSSFVEVFYQGMQLPDVGAQALSVCQISNNVVGNKIYIIGLMLSLDRPSAPNPLPGPYAPNGLYIGAENNGLSAAQAFNVLPFSGTPSGTAPNGSLGINISATGTGSLYQYLNHAWVQIH